MAQDARVSAVLDLLGGATLDDVAREHGLDPRLLERWAEQFVLAGEAAVTNTPAASDAAGRDRFLSAIAHELRTPLTILTGWMTLLGRDSLPEEQRKQIATAVTDNLQRLEQTIELMEDTTAASLGRLPLEAGTVDLRDVARGQAPELFHEEDGPEGDATVRGDARRLGHVIDDLTRSLGTVSRTKELRLTVRSEGSWVRVTLRRRGEPLTADAVHALFEPFGERQGQSEVTFGLYRARALVTAHGGQLGVDADEDGESFWVRIPRHPSSAPAAPNSQRHLRIVKEDR